MRILTGTSHLDHSLTTDQIAFIAERYADQEGFLIDTIELPAELGTVPCGLYGPCVGDEPVPNSEVVEEVRGGRGWASRLVERPTRPSRQLTVIMGGHTWEDADGVECSGTILYTAFGGPLAPKEPGDPSIGDADTLEQSREFWSEHALAR